MTFTYDSPMFDSKIVHHVNHGEEDEMEMYGYKPNIALKIITWTAITLSGFILRLIFSWRPQWMLYATHVRCRLDEATKVLLIDRYNQYFVEKIEYIQTDLSRKIHKQEKKYLDNSDHIANNGKYTLTGEGFDNFKFVKKVSNSLDVELKESRNKDNANERLKYFNNKKLRYIWDDSHQAFVKLQGLDKTETLDTLFAKFVDVNVGLTHDEQAYRRNLYGDNAIHVEVQSYMRILFHEVLGPFYIFQVFSMAIWYIDDYFYYGTCIIIMSLLSLVSGVVQIRRNQEQLRNTVESVDYVKVCRRDGTIDEVESSEIVPGDVVVVPTFDTILHYDALLLNGTVIVNESMLTGESVPVTKTPISVNNYHGHTHYYDSKEHAKHTLYCGTRVLQTRYYGGGHARALVLRSGFQTAKGELIRSIMFPRPVDYQFNRQINRFIGLLAGIALIGFLYTVIIKSQRGATLGSIVLSALDLITIVVPPALPAAMTIGLIYAQSRLKKNRIYCISPRSINISGSINCVCFDKTGTLTEDHLSFNEIVPVDEESCEFGDTFDEDSMTPEAIYTAMSSQRKDQDETTKNYLVDSNGNFTPLMICLASCHSLTIIDDKLIGDPLDLQMFKATGWQLEEPEDDDNDENSRIKNTNSDSYKLAEICVGTIHLDQLNTSILETQCKLNNRDQGQNGDSRRSSSRLSAPTVVKPPQSLKDKENNSQTETDDVIRCLSKNHDVGILRQFTFSSSLQRMSVVTRRFDSNQFIVYTKGAPEKIAALCDPETIPDDFSDVLVKYTRRGYRVLALAYRKLSPEMDLEAMQRATRSQLEIDFKFLGLLTLGNLLKPETTNVIRTLNSANIRSVMVTGDNMLTALSVACDCQMIERNDKIVMLQINHRKRSKRGGKTSKNNRLKPNGQGGMNGGSLSCSLAANPIKSSQTLNILENDRHQDSQLCNHDDNVSSSNSGSTATIARLSMNEQAISAAHSQTALSDTTETDITVGSCDMILNDCSDYLTETQRAKSTELITASVSASMITMAQNPMNGHNGNDQSIATTVETNTQSSSTFGLDKLGPTHTINLTANHETIDGTKPKLVWHYVNSMCSDDDDIGLQTIPETTTKINFESNGENTCIVKIPDELDSNGNEKSHVPERIHIALNGETWDAIRTYYPDLLDSICVRGTVFARMSPEQKQQLVEHLQSLDYYVGMCGDGANDSGALRSAHAGISLSDTEASVAAPFTSAAANISCIPTLICEGRAALVTAFGILKYMALYSLIQFCSVIILYSMYTNLTDMQFLYIDLFIITLFVALFARTKPYGQLAKVPPSSSLLSLAQLSSVSIQIFLVVFFQLLSVIVLWQQPWYHAHSQQYDNNKNDHLAGHDNYAIFAVSVFQYITLAIVFSKDKPYRQSIWTNCLFMLAIVVMSSLTIVILLIPSSDDSWNPIMFDLDFEDTLPNGVHAPGTIDVPLHFKFTMLSIAFIHFCCAMIGERLLVDRLIFTKGTKLLEALGSKVSGARFKQIERKSHGIEWLTDATTEEIS